MEPRLYRRYLRMVVSLVLLAVIAALLLERGHREENSYKSLREENLNFTILIQGGDGKSAGVRSTLIYYILDDFKQKHKCKVSLSIREDEPERWMELMAGEVDALILNSAEDTVPEFCQESVVSTIALDENEDVLVLSRDSYNLLQIVNYWISYYRQTPEFRKLSRQYKGSTRGFARAISPYDPFIRKYSAELGWDWRLLAALIYTESKFQVGVSSSRG